MSDDADSDVLGGDLPPDSFSDIILHAAGGVQWKLFALMFLVYILIMCDIFDRKILGRFRGATVDGDVTTYGIAVKGLILVLACIIIDVALKTNIV